VIELSYPTFSSRYYIFYWRLLIGPMQIDGSQDYLSQLIRTDLDTITEKRGIFGENDVIHVKYDGHLQFHPALVDAKHVPTEKFPQAITYKYTRNGKLISGTALHGILQPGWSGLGVTEVTSDGATYYYEAHDYNGKDWFLYRAIVNENDPYCVRWDCTKFSDIVCHTSSMSAEFTKTWSSIDWFRTKNHNWFDDHSSYAIINLPKTYGLRPYVSRPSREGSHLIDFNCGVNPRELTSCIQDYISENIHLRVCPLEPDDYSELAVEAVQKVPKVRANLLELLSEIRHPWRLLPKLKNLRYLKTWSDNYLWMNYGLLPTISDLQEIVRAFKKHGPYFDKNGFATYNASKVKRQSTKDFDYSLTQRLKIAIENEDHAIINLLDSIDSIGLLPKLSNIWDLVPFSFVIDWFLGVGDMLERFEVNEFLTHHKIRYVTMSYRKVTDLKISMVGLPILGSIQKVLYHRWVSDQCPAPPLTLQLKTATAENFIDGMMLLNQRRK